MSKKKDHGDRNLSLSIDLLTGGKFYDWVVTICFYATIHFIEDVILPCEINNIECKNIGEVRNAYKLKGRHEARAKLVGDKLANVSHCYDWLDDKSRYSRYTTYKVTFAEAEKAKNYAHAIQKACYTE